MTLPIINPAAFALRGCCNHWGCSCVDCTGLVGTTWFKIGDRLISDQAIMLPPAILDPAPKITQPTIVAAPFDELLAQTYSDTPSTEEFHTRYLVPLEAAGYQVRPPAGRAVDPSDRTVTARVHGILHNGVAIGLIMPLYLHDATVGRRAA